MAENIVKSAWAYIEGKEDPELMFAWDAKEFELDKDGFWKLCSEILKRSDVESISVLNVEVDSETPNLNGKTMGLKAKRIACEDGRAK